VRKYLIVVLTLAVVLVPAGAAWARGGEWQKVNNPPAEGACGSTTVHVTYPIDEEYYRLITLPDGTVEQQITGRLVANFATDAGASLYLNSSGPGKLFFFTNGDVEYRGTGLFSGPGFFVPSGPEILWSAGLIDVLFHSDGSITYIRTPHHITDVCAALGL
jgi:hypothetical protein